MLSTTRTGGLTLFFSSLIPAGSSSTVSSKNLLQQERETQDRNGSVIPVRPRVEILGPGLQFGRGPGGDRSVDREFLAFGLEFTSGPASFLELSTWIRLAAPFV